MPTPAHHHDNLASEEGATAPLPSTSRQLLPPSKKLLPILAIAALSMAGVLALAPGSSWTVALSAAALLTAGVYVGTTSALGHRTELKVCLGGAAAALSAITLIADAYRSERAPSIKAAQEAVTNLGTSLVEKYAKKSESNELPEGEDQPATPDLSKWPMELRGLLNEAETLLDKPSSAWTLLAGIPLKSKVEAALRRYDAALHDEPGSTAKAKVLSELSRSDIDRMKFSVSLSSLALGYAQAVALWILAAALLLAWQTRKLRLNILENPEEASPAPADEDPLQALVRKARKQIQECADEANAKTLRDSHAADLDQMLLTSRLPNVGMGACQTGFIFTFLLSLGNALMNSASEGTLDVTQLGLALGESAFVLLPLPALAFVRNLITEAAATFGSNFNLATNADIQTAKELHDRRLQQKKDAELAKLEELKKESMAKEEWERQEQLAKAEQEKQSRIAKMERDRLEKLARAKAEKDRFEELKRRAREGNQPKPVKINGNHATLSVTPQAQDNSARRH